MEINQKRNYGIDLLRILLMYMVCMLHVLGQGGILYASVDFSIKNRFYWLLEILCYCAVDGYALISGYVSNKKLHDYSKLLNMWLQVFFYSFVITVLLVVFGVVHLGFVTILKTAFPITTNVYFYFTGYFILLLIIPYINSVTDEISEKNAKLAFWFLFVLGTVINGFTDAFVINNGYSSIWIIVLYIMGRLMKKGEILSNASTSLLCLLFLLSSSILWIVDYIGVFKLINLILFSNFSIVSYTSPMIMFNAIILVTVFSRLTVRGKFVKKISPMVFGVYLLQLNPVIYNQLIKDRFIFITRYNLFYGVMIVLGISLGILVVGLIIELLRRKIFDFLHLPLLVDKIVKSKCFNH